MLNIGGPELLIILLVALIFLGPQRLPDVARQLGQAVSSLRSLASGFQAEIEAATKLDPAASMTLDGPTDQTEAIAKTQPGAIAEFERGPVAKQPATAGTDTESLKAAARQVDPSSGDEKLVSTGGPTDLGVSDEVVEDLEAEDLAAEATADEEE